MENKINININSLKSLYIDIFFNELRLSTATGFLINSDGNLYLITNRHVVTGRDNQTNKCLNTMGSIPNKIKVWIPQNIGKCYTWSNMEIELYDENSTPIWLEHKTFGSKVDVVGILLEKNISNTFYYNLKSDYIPIVTEQMYIIGYPFGFDVSPKNGKFAIWTSGRAASDPDLNLNINDEQLPAFLVDSRTRGGQSGSPVIYYSDNGMLRNSNGFSISSGPVMREIGIYSGRINAESDLGYVWKWSVIEEIINQKNKSRNKTNKQREKKSEIRTDEVIYL